MPRRDERGVGTMLGVLAMAVLLLAAAVVCAGVTVAGRAHRATAAADLAALAGAQRLADGGAPCPAAASVAVRNGATVTGCSVEGRDVVVTVVVQSPRLFGASWALHGTARAGPA